MKKILIAIYFVFHLLVAFLGIRVWPLTDYPMFGWSFPKREKIHSYFWAFQTSSGDKMKVFEPQYGRGDMRTFIHAYKGDIDKLELIAVELLEKAPLDASSLILVDRFVQRMPDETFEIREETVFKKSVQ